LHITLLGDGECLIDDVQVFAEGGASNMVANSSFDAGLKGWTVLGNHIQSALKAQGGYGDGPCLHLKATGRGDTGANQVRVPLVGYGALQPNRTATMRARVRWLKGFPEVLLRLRGNYLEAFGRLNVPAAPGTPGRENTCRVANAGPAITEVTHWPVLPAADTPVRVLATVSDPQGVSGVWLNYRVDPGTNVVSVQMHDDGTESDSIAGDRVFTGTVPRQAGGTLVAFNVTASDGADTPAISRFPEINKKECLVRFGEVVPASSFGNYRLWLTASNVAGWRGRPVLSNEEIDGTFIYGTAALYNVGALFRQPLAPELL
jgi:hypothetical protein